MPREPEQSAGVFALIGPPSDSNHLYAAIDYYRGTKGLPPKRFSSHATLLKFLEWLPPFPGRIFEKLVTPAGVSVSGMHIWCPIMPEMVATMGQGDSFRKHVRNRVEEACRVAADRGATIISLGGFSSIAVVGHEEEISARIGVPVTSGNTFTASLTIAGIEGAVRATGRSFKDATVAMLGATGDIGQGVSRWLGRKVKRLIITARDKPRLEAFAKELRTRSEAEILSATDNHWAAQQADIVVAAAISTQPIISSDDVRPGTIICDVGYPKNVSIEMSDRSDVLTFLGGLSLPPWPFDFGYSSNLPSADVLYGCMSEAVVLACSGRSEVFSHGRGNITAESMDEIWKMARTHGFDVSPFFSARRLLKPEDLEPVLQAAQMKRSVL
jgi:fatty aldehyde-generating acyl-ACP reductase